MHEIKFYEKQLKKQLKNKQKITLSLIVAFLISGGAFYQEAQGRDLRDREKNNIKSESRGPDIKSSANETDVINIVNPDSNGVSHNKFVDLSVGTGNGLIFNNSKENGVSQIGGYLIKNPNLINNAKVILNEVTGVAPSNINGDIEIFGKRADFILANENGISLNNATFINTGGITLSTGKVINSGNNIGFDIQRGDINLNGVGTSGNYFNVLAKTIGIFKEISPLSGEALPDISIIAGKNNLNMKVQDLGDVEIVSSGEDKSNKYGIYASQLGAMYGKNIRLISTDKGLGVKHEGLVTSEQNINISSNGDIILTSINSKGKVNIIGDSLITNQGTSINKGEAFINSISGKDNVNLEIKGDIVLQSALQSIDGDIKITAKNLTLWGKTSARIISQKDIRINLSEKLDVQGVMIPTIQGKSDLELSIIVEKDGKLGGKDIKTGKIYSSKNIIWVTTGLVGTQIELYVKELKNKGLISADKNLKIFSRKINNEETGVIKGAKVNIEAEKRFINKGEIRENKEELDEFVDPLGNLKIKVSLGNFENYSNISAQKITVLTQSLINSFNGKIIATNGDIIFTTSIGELINNGDILTNKNVQLISGALIENRGKIGGNNVIIEALNGNFLNIGQITAIKELEVVVKSLINAGDTESIEKYLNIFYQYSKENLDKVIKITEELKERIENEVNEEKKAALNGTLSYFVNLKTDLVALKDEIGKIGNLGVLSGADIKVKSVENIKNHGIVVANKEVKVDGKNIENYGVIQGGENIFLKAIGSILNTQRLVATKEINISGDIFTSTGDDRKILEYLELVARFDEEKLNSIKSKISSFKELGVIESNTIVITTIKALKNKGIVLIEEDARLSSKGTINNSGLANIGGDLDVQGEKLVSNDLTIGKTLKGEIKKLFETKDLKVGEGVNISVSKMLNTGKLDINEDLNLKGDLVLTSNSDIQVKRDINILGGFNNSGKIINNGDLNIDALEKDIVNTGKLGIKGQGIIKGEDFINSGDILIEKGIDLNLNGGVQNNSTIITKGNLSADVKKEFISSELSVGNNLSIKTGDLSSNNLLVEGKAEIISSGESFQNLGELHISKELIIDAKNIINAGEIISTGLDLTMKKNLNNIGSIQSKGDIDIKNRGKDSIFNSKGEIISLGDINIDFKDGKIVSGGKLTTNGNLEIKSKIFINENKVESGDLSLITEEFLNKEKAEIIVNSVDINGNRVNFNNYGKIQSNTNINIDLNGSFNDSNLGKIFANKEIFFKGSLGDLNIDKIQTLDDIFIETKGKIINNGMVISNKNINLSANFIKNGRGTTIWAGQNIFLTAINEIYNSLLSVIEGKENVKLISKSLINDSGAIKSGKNMLIKADTIINKSTFVDNPLVGKGSREFETVTSWNDILNYHLDYVKVNIPTIENTMIIKEKGSIASNGDLEIEGVSKKESNIQNKGATISASKDIQIFGNLKNETPYKEISVEWLLNNIKVKLHWETKLYGTGAHGNSGTSFEGSLKDALYKGYFSKRNSYYESLKIQNDSTLNKVLSSFLGPDWKIHNKPTGQDKWNLNGRVKYYAANANAKILAGEKLTHSQGIFDNDGGESGEDKSIKVEIKNNMVDEIKLNLEVNIKDINLIKEIEGVKYIHDIEIIAGEVTINGVTIKAETGNIAGSIAVAGTIKPIIFIDIPVGENGVFKPATSKPGQIQPLFETNIEFIDSNKFYGSNYFFEQIGYNKNKPSTVIGDAYYENILLSKMLREGIGYIGELNTNSIKNLLDNALKFEKQLGLEIGKPLNPQQINRLEKDIIWYVEIEVNGTKVLVPQIYFSKESRIRIANGQGGGGTSTVKVGGDFITDNTSFNNESGNIVANGSIIIKSQGDITNNSSSGINGGITSAKGNIALDASGDINIIGGSVKGDNIIFSGNEVNIESTVGLDRDGKQVISDKVSIDGDNGIQIVSKNNINIKGGSLTASGLEFLPKEEPKNESSEVSPKEEEEVAVKDVNYYEELFRKDSADIIEGAAGSINLNAGGSISIKDIQTTSSTSKNEYIDHSNYFKESSSKVISNEAKIVGSNVNINAEKDINIKGSSIETNEGLISKDDKNEYVQGDINLNAKNNIVIEDSQESYSKKGSSAQSSIEKGLVSVKWSDKETNVYLSKGSSISTSGSLNISSGNDIVLKGSKIETGGNTSINAKNNIDILDGRDTIEESTSDTRYQVLGGGNITSEKKSSTSKGSSISTGGKIELNSGNNIKIVNGILNSSKDTEIIAKNDGSIEAGKNEYSEKTTTTNVGIYVDGSVGIGGVGVSGSATTADMSASGEISSEWGANGIIGEKLDGSNEKIPTTSGKPHMDQLVNSEVGLKIEHSTKKIDEATWSESQLKGDNITIKAGNTVDIGGGDYEAENSVTIKSKKVDTSKYEDIRNEKTDGFAIVVKQSQGVNSSIVDTVNTGVKMNAAIKSGQANEGVLAAQGIGAVTNLLFNDLVGVFSKQSVNISIEKSTKNETSENITSIKGKNIDIIATEGDINLNGIDIKSEENISLDAKNNINVSAAKKISSESGLKVDLEAQLEQTAGYSALWGGNTDIGVGGSANVDVISSTSKEMINSIIKSDGNLIIKSGGDTNIKGGEIETKKDATIKVGGNLNIESQKSSYKEDSINANAGGNVSIGAASNTIGKGELGFSAGGGNLWKNGEIVQQSGIKSGGNLVVDVGGDLNMSGAILGSETGNGNLKVDGNINLKDLVTNEKQGGANITVSGGFTGDMGVDGTIGDIKDKQVISKSTIGLDKKNIKLEGIIDLNGQSGTVDNIYTDMKNIQIIERDILKKGGDVSFSGSIENVKNVKNKITQEKLIKNLTKELEDITDKVDKNRKTLKDKVMESGEEKPVEKVEAPPLLYGNPDNYKFLSSDIKSTKNKEILNIIEKEVNIKIEHRPNKNTKNLEDPYTIDSPNFGDVALIYGAAGNESSSNREEMIFSVKTNGNAPLIADSYLDAFNSRHIPLESDNYVTDELKQVISAITKDKNISNNVLEIASQFKSSDKTVEEVLHIDKVNVDSNKELLSDLLKKDEVVNALKRIDELNNILLSNKNFSEEKIDNLTEEIEENYKIFFANKTITLADKILKRGGKIYFTLDGIGTSTTKDGKLYLDKKKLKDILFNKNSEFYDAVTSQEIRFLYKNHLNNSGLKFLVNKQVIVFPKLD